MPDILHLLDIGAAPGAVYRALATAEGIRGWWTRDATLDERQGGAGEMAFYDRRVVTRVRIDALDPPTRVAWTVVESGAPGGWTGTAISFGLRPFGDGGTRLMFAHRGFAAESEDFARVSTGWAYFLVSLKRYAETGTGVPAPDVDFFRMVG